MAIIWANSSQYNLSITFTIYSRTPAKTSTGEETIWTDTKERPFSLRNLLGESQEEQVQHAIPLMDEVAKELHHLTGFGIDRGRIKSGSKVIKQIAYPDLPPTSDQNLVWSLAITLFFDAVYTYQWVKDGKEKSSIDTAELLDGWQKRPVFSGRSALFRIPAVGNNGFFQLRPCKNWDLEYNKQDSLFQQFISRFHENGQLAFGQSREFGKFSHIRYDYWPQAKKPEKYGKKSPRKSHLATQLTDNTEYVYIIKVQGENIYKIGKSNDPQSRLNSLQPASPYKLKIIHKFTADNASTAEETLHELLSSYRMEGEWFNIPKRYSDRLVTIERFENKHFWIDKKAVDTASLFR